MKDSIILLSIVKNTQNGFKDAPCLLSSVQVFENNSNSWPWPIVVINYKLKTLR